MESGPGAGRGPSDVVDAAVVVVDVDQVVVAVVVAAVVVAPVVVAALVAVAVVVGVDDVGGRAWAAVAPSPTSAATPNPAESAAMRVASVRERREVRMSLQGATGRGDGRRGRTR